MKRKTNTFLKRAISVVLLFAILGLIANKIVFTHIHIAENGELISHAHPFSKSSDKSHSHSSNDYTFLDHLDILFICITLGLATLILRVIHLKEITAFNMLLQDLANWKATRAPPAFDSI